MTKHQIALLEAALIPVASFTALSAEDITDEKAQEVISGYKAEQLSYWKDKHPDYSPEKIKEMEKKLRDEGFGKAMRLFSQKAGIPDAEAKGKSPEDLYEIAKEKLGKGDSTAEEYKSKLAALEVEYKKLQDEVIPGIHNEYKSKEIESARAKKIDELFSDLPVLDNIRSDFHLILKNRMDKLGIHVKLSEDGKALEFYDADGTKARVKGSAKEMDASAYKEIVKAELQAGKYLKESNGNSGSGEAKRTDGRPKPIDEKRQKLLESQREHPI